MTDRPKVPLPGTRSGPLDLVESLSRRGISRRQFMQFCTAMAATLALPASAVPDMARALQATRRVPAVYFEFQDCAGCIEAFLRAPHPTIAEIVLDLLSLNYQETIMAAAGEAAEAAAAATIEEGGYLLLVEGAIPLKDDGVYCCIAGRTALDIVREAAETAVAAIATGNCACFGNIPAANPNPTGAVGLREVIRNIPVVNMAGCPPNAINLAAVVTHYLTFNSLPALDHHARPVFAYGERIHDHCPRRPHFDAGQFVEQWGDEGHRLSWCLYKMGCKGPQTYHNCPVVEYNEGTSWPIEAGHPCVGCSEPQFWDTMTPFYRRLPEVTGLTVESNVDTIGLVLTGATAVAIGAHAVGSILRKRQPLPAADAELSEGAIVDEPLAERRVVDRDVEEGE
ncbi:MAG TPA: hydrogenase small subunit [Anaerolineae bacterium]|nr:hydrogenase small subunit [Anaerolineae bacterium]